MAKLKTIMWDGVVISKPCIIKGMPLRDYHSQCCEGPSVSSTNLRRVLESNDGSPAHMFAEWSGNPECVEQEDKAHFVVGRAVHHLMLGEKMFKTQFAIRPDKWRDWRTVDSRDWRDHIVRSGKSVLVPSDIENIKGMAIALGRDPLVRQGLLGGQIERSLFWRDKETGLWCKSRPDAMPTDSGDFADLKTTTSVQYNDLARSVRDFAYHQQAAFVAEGAKICAGIDMVSFTFVFVEKSPPYCVRLVHLTKEDIELAHKQNVLARRLIAGCLKSGRWLGPGEGHIVNIKLGERYREQAMQVNAEIEQALR